MSILLDTEHFLLDIETNGLSHEKHHVVCIGVMYMRQDGELMTHQWSLQKAEEERDLLSQFITFANQFKFVYTYSGRRFDWPFLLARIAHFGLVLSPIVTLVDMKKTLQLLSPTRNRLEEALGFKRETSTAGKELVKLYQTYEASGDVLYQKIILSHNLEELKSLLLFYKVYYILYHLKHFTVATTFNQLNESSLLHLTFKLPCDDIPSFTLQCEAMTLSKLQDKSLLNITLPIHHKVLQKPLIPVKDYYYIPSQNQLLHKSLATFIPSDMKRKATKSECFVEKLDDYFKLYTTTKVTAAIWYDSSQQPYTPYVSSKDFELLVIQQLFYYFFQTQKK